MNEFLPKQRFQNKVYDLSNNTTKDSPGIYETSPMTGQLSGICNNSYFNSGEAIPVKHIGIFREETPATSGVRYEYVSLTGSYTWHNSGNATQKSKFKNGEIVIRGGKKYKYAERCFNKRGYSFVQEVSRPEENKYGLNTIHSFKDDELELEKDRDYSIIV